MKLVTQPKIVRIVLAMFGLWWASNVMAAPSYGADIGYTALVNYLSAQQRSAPTGAGVTVMLVEASQITTDPDPSDNTKTVVTSLAWAPETNGSEFTGKNFSYANPGYSPIPVGATSGHATGVAGIFFGNNSSIASGIDNVEVHQADHWLIDGFLNTYDTSTSPAKLKTEPPLASSARVANHSYVGSDAGLTPVLARADWVTMTDQLINVVAMNNRDPLTTPNTAAQRMLLAGAYNAIAVGRTDGNHATGTVINGLDAPYNTVRVRPDLVAPMGTTSAATPVVSAAAALLVEAGHKGGSTLSSGFTFSRTGNADGNVTEAERIYNAERAETVKAALMAGADRTTHNASGANIADYRSTGNRTDNGLDSRFGAGQVNVFTSYRIIAGGERDTSNGSANIGCDAGTVLCAGFDFADSFGGTSSRSAEYRFTTGNVDGWLLGAALVWNIQVASDFNSATLNNLDLELRDGNGGVLFTSASTLDNTENLWVNLAGNTSYTLRVLAVGGDFSQAYALAWQISAVPLPAGIWLMIPALSVLATRYRRHASDVAKLM